MSKSNVMAARIGVLASWLGCMSALGARDVVGFTGFAVLLLACAIALSFTTVRRIVRAAFPAASVARCATPLQVTVVEAGSSLNLQARRA